MTEEQLSALVAHASHSPSVHNVQPARWQIDGSTLLLLEDPARRLTVGDPTRNDAGLSLGAAAEGLAIAAADAGYRTVIERCTGHSGGLPLVARLHFAPATVVEPLAAVLERRASWRGPFQPVAAADLSAAAVLQGEDRTIITDPVAIAAIAASYDRASYGFIRRAGFRAELRGWMRLRPSHPGWSRDGLNAAAMQLAPLEAAGAGLVLGPLFRLLAALGLTRALLAERKSFDNATGIALFHRPSAEDPFESGRHFHRLWLALEAAGFGANVLAALADDPEAAAGLCADHGLPAGHRLVSAFRFGRRDGTGFARARLPLSELLIG